MPTLPLFAQLGDHNISSSGNAALAIQLCVITVNLSFPTCYAYNPGIASNAETQVALISSSTARQTTLTTSPFTSLAIPAKSPDTKHCLPNFFATNQSRSQNAKNLIDVLTDRYLRLDRLVLLVENSARPVHEAYSGPGHRRGEESGMW